MSNRVLILHGWGGSLKQKYDNLIYLSHNIKPPVGRVVLIPTQAQTTNNFNHSNKNQYANIFDFIKAFYFANFCRDRGNPTYGISLNQKHYNLTYLSQKLFFNVKILKNKKNSI